MGRPGLGHSPGRRVGTGRPDSDREPRPSGASLHGQRQREGGAPGPLPRAGGPLDDHTVAGHQVALIRP